MGKQTSVKVACDVFITRNNQLLLGKRKNCYGAGGWALPGGHLEIGEKMIEAAKREIKEELGIDNVNLKLIAISDFIGETKYVHIAFLLKNYKGKYRLMEPDKCEEWKFFSLNKLPENIIDSHQNLIKSFKEGKIYLY